MQIPIPSARRHGESRHHVRRGRREHQRNYRSSNSSGSCKSPGRQPVSNRIKSVAISAMILSMAALAVGIIAIMQGMQKTDVNHVKKSLNENQKQLNDLQQKHLDLRQNLNNVSKRVYDELHRHHAMLKDSHSMKKSLDSLVEAHEDEDNLSIVRENIRLKKNITKILGLIRKNSAYSLKQSKLLIGNISILEDKLYETEKKAASNDLRISKFLAKRSCKELQIVVGKRSGVYEILIGSNIVEVFCDMKTDDGGWLIMQKRLGGIVDFYQDFQTYVEGFGDRYKEYWLGLNNLHLMTKAEKYELRVELEDWNGNRSFAKYKEFSVGDRATNYKLTIKEYSGDAGDGLTYHNNRPFSAKNRDNDADLLGNCAKNYHGAWWYGACHASNLNGEYLRGGQIKEGGVNWWFWKKNWYSMKSSEMKIRPK